MNQGEESNKKDIIACLPLELSVRILGFVNGPKTLSRCSMVSTTWRKAATDEILWRDLCQARWRIKKHIEFRLHPRVDYRSLVDSMSIKEIKQVLQARMEDTKGLIEKSEFVQKLLTTLPKNSPAQKSIVWSSKWKASFIVAELDATRTILTKEELCSFQWKIWMKNWPEDVDYMHCRFNRDYTYESDMLQPGHTMKWRFYANDVQVESFPSLVITRRKDWGFQLENPHALLQSVV